MTDIAIKLILLSLPFNYGLTLYVGFNFKIYEIVFLCLIFTKILQKLCSGSLAIGLEKNYKDVKNTVLLLFIAICLSNLIAFYFFNINIIGSGIRYQWAAGRFSPLVNSPIAILYIIFSLLIFLYMLENISRANINTIVKAWLAGAFLSVAYLIYCNLALHTALPEIVLPGMDEGFQYGSVFGVELVRSGTFKEGNFFSGYLLASAVFSYYLYLKENRKKYLVFSFVFMSSVFLTLSTVGVILIFLFWTIYFFSTIVFIRGIKWTSKLKFILIIPVMVALLSFSGAREYIGEVVIEKIIYTDVADAPTAYSKFDRLDTLIKAVYIFLDYPIFGVGTYNFGFYYPLYWTEEVFSDGTDFKKIPNNVYIQLLCENGLFVMIFLLLFFAVIFKRFLKIAEKKKEHLLMITLFMAILIKWNAYPSYTLAYDWVSIAIIIYSFGNGRDTDSSAAGPSMVNKNI